MPDINKNPEQFFKFIDIDNSGSINKKEIIEILKAIMNIEEYQIEEYIN